MSHEAGSHATESGDHSERWSALSPTRFRISARRGQRRGAVYLRPLVIPQAAGAREVCTALLAEIEQQGITDVIVTTSDCAGQCRHEPMATVEVQGGAPVKYVNLTPETIVRILRQHVCGGAIVVDSALAAGCETTG